MALWFKGPNPTVDLVLFAGENNPSILMVQRATNPFMGSWALPGGFVDSLSGAGEVFEPKESPETAAKRELLEETSVMVEGNLIPIGMYEGNNRDPRDEVDAWTRTHAFAVRVSHKSDTVPQEGEVQKCDWIPVSEILSGNVQCAFDHAQIIRDASDKVLGLKQGPSL